MVLLDRIVDPLQRYVNFESLFAENDLVQNAAVALYCDLLDFSYRILLYYSKASLCQSKFPVRLRMEDILIHTTVNVSTSFDKDLLEVSDNVRHHWTELDIASSAISMDDAKKARETETMQRQCEQGLSPRGIL